VWECFSLHPLAGPVLYPWVNCTGIRTLNPGFRGSPLTHGYKTDPIMIHKRVTGALVCLSIREIIAQRLRMCVKAKLTCPVASVRPNLVPCFNLVLPSLEPPAHTFRAQETCWHAGEGLPCCPVTSSGTSSAANGRAGEEYQVRARYQVRANPLLSTTRCRYGPVRPPLCFTALRYPRRARPLRCYSTYNIGNSNIM